MLSPSRPLYCVYLVVCRVYFFTHLCELAKAHYGLRGAIVGPGPLGPRVPTWAHPIRAQGPGGTVRPGPLGPRRAPFHSGLANWCLLVPSPLASRAARRWPNRGPATNGPRGPTRARLIRARGRLLGPGLAEPSKTKVKTNKSNYCSLRLPTHPRC